MSKFIVLEGIEGSGKSTQARLLGEWLAAEGIPHVLTREPGGTVVGEGVRSLVLHGDAMSAETELLLYLTARSALITEIVRPALERGEVVIADRYEMSTFAYQGAGRGLSLDEVRAINHFATGGLKPDLTVVIEVPSAVGTGRLTERGGPDRIERAGRSFHERVAAAYGQLVRTEPDVEAVDGGGDVTEVQERLVRLLQRRFPETFVRTQG